MTEAFLERHGCLSNGRVIVQYNDVWVVLEESPSVYLRGETIDPKLIEVQEKLIKISEELLKNRKTIAEVYNANVLKLDIETTTPVMDELLAKIRTDPRNEIDAILVDNMCTGVIVFFKDIQVFLPQNKVLTKWKETESAELVQRAIDLLRYPHLDRYTSLQPNIIRNIENRNPIDDKGDVIAKAIENQIRDNIISAFLRAKDTIRIKYPYGIHVDLSVDKQSLSHNNTEYSEHPLIDHAIKLLMYPIDVEDDGYRWVYNVEKNHLVPIQAKLHSLAQSTATFKTYTINEDAKGEIIHALLDYNKFSISDNTIGVGFDNADEQDEFEEKYALEINLYTNMFTLYTGENLDLVELAPYSKVTFVNLEGAEYYFRLQDVDDNKVRISISGEPSMRHPAIQAHYFRETNHIDIHDFFLFNNHSKRYINSTSGHGPRGMLLIKFVAQILGANIVIVDDLWEYKRDHDTINSDKLTDILATLETDTSLEGWHENTKRSIRKWIFFYTQNQTWNKVKDHGYFGGFGFTSCHEDRDASPELFAPEGGEPWHNYNSRAKQHPKIARVEDIVGL